MREQAVALLLISLLLSGQGDCQSSELQLRREEMHYRIHELCKQAQNWKDSFAQVIKGRLAILNSQGKYPLGAGQAKAALEFTAVLHEKAISMHKAGQLPRLLTLEHLPAIRDLKVVEYRKIILEAYESRAWSHSQDTLERFSRHIIRLFVGPVGNSDGALAAESKLRSLLRLLDPKVIKKLDMKPIWALADRAKLESSTEDEFLSKSFSYIQPEAQRQILEIVYKSQDGIRVLQIQPKAQRQFDELMHASPESIRALQIKSGYAATSFEISSKPRFR